MDHQSVCWPPVAADRLPDAEDVGRLQHLRQHEMQQDAAADDQGQHARAERERLARRHPAAERRVHRQHGEAAEGGHEQHARQADPRHRIERETAGPQEQQEEDDSVGGGRGRDAHGCRLRAEAGLQRQRDRDVGRDAEDGREDRAPEVLARQKAGSSTFHQHEGRQPDGERPEHARHGGGIAAVKAPRS